MTAGWAGVAAAAVMAAATAQGASAAAPRPPELMPAFPASEDANVLTRWVRDSAGMPLGVPIQFGPDSAVALLTDSTEGLGPSMHSVTFREEATSIGFVTRNGGRSLSGAGEVNCTDGTVKLASLVIYLGNGLRGDRVTSFPAQTTFRQPAAGTVLDRVVQTACYVPPPVPAARQAYVSPPVPARPPQAAPAPVAAAPQPLPSGLLPARPPTIAAAELPPLPSPRVMEAPAPEPAPGPVAEPAPPPPPPPPEPAPAPAPAPPAPPPAVPPAPESPALRPALPAPAPAARPAASGPATVQIGAFGTSEQAFVALDGLATLVPDQLGGTSQTVTPAMVNGAQVFRALVGGFASRAQAQAFCAALTEKGASCLVRP